ncbi:MAG: prepilin-type N-terminal cleavage/methylation domain-containing protein [Verrucomicrobiota bacterium]
MELARKRSASSLGFTLVEVMIAASLAIVVFAMAFSAMIRFSKVHYSLATQADMDREFRYVVNHIADDFRGLTSIEINEPEDDKDDEPYSVVLTLPNFENENGVTPVSTEITYMVSDNAELRRAYAEYSAQGLVLNNNTKRLLQDVTEFSVERVDGTGSYDFTLITERKAGGSAYTKESTTRVTPRN